MNRYGLLTLVFVHALVGCSDDKTGFGSGGGGSGATWKKPVVEPVKRMSGKRNSAGESVSASPAKDTFNVAQSAGKVDIVWVVDQSGSMKTETTNVQNNLKDFISKVNARIDARHALIASRTRGLALDIDALGIAGEQVKQIDQEVRSNDALSIAASAFTRPDAPRNPAVASRFAGIQGTLVDFFRPGVRPIVVVVTDDNAEGVDQTNFISILEDKTNSIGIKPLVYAFAGLENSSAAGKCDIAAVGTAYSELANASTPKAEVFDICQADWTESFKKLTEGIFVAAENSFRLKKPAAKILKVSVNGKAIDASAYTYTAGTLTVRPEALETAGGGTIQVVVDYQP